MSNQPILSICIPTFNRAGAIYFTLKSITEQEIFIKTNNIEIVIFNNCSTDYTEEIISIFKNKYPDKIVYYKSEENIDDTRFEKVLSLGRGKLLKLHNDNFIFKEGSLQKIIDLIKSQEKEKNIIFFSNGNFVQKDILCENLNSFIQNASYLSTWIAAFSIWKDDFNNINNFSKNVNTNLIQTDVILRLLAVNKKIFITSINYITSIDIFSKGGYNIAKIFGEKYFYLLKHYLNKGISTQTYENEKKKMLEHIIEMKFGQGLTHRTWRFENDGYWRYLLPIYYNNAYFYYSIISIICHIIDADINKIYRYLNRNSYQKYWKKRNKNNQTTISATTQANKIFVGDNSVGNINLISTNNPNELLIIGKNVVIENNVKFDLTKNKLIIIKDNEIITSGRVIV